MDPLHEVLIPMGVNVVSNAIWDGIKAILKKGDLTEKEVTNEFRAQFPQINISQAEIISHTAIQVLAEKGEIEIRGTKIHSNSFNMTTLPGSNIKFTGSKSETASGSVINTEGNSSIDLSNGGQIQQPSNGDIIIKA